MGWVKSSTSATSSSDALPLLLALAVAASIPESIASISSWLAAEGGGAGARTAAGSGALGGGAAGLRPSGRGLGLGRVRQPRFALVIGNDPADGGEDLLHGRFLRLRRLSHFRIPASAARLRAYAANRYSAGTLSASRRQMRIGHVDDCGRKKPWSRGAATAWLFAIRRAETQPAVAHLMVMDARVVKRRRQAKLCGPGSRPH